MARIIEDAAGIKDILQRTKTIAVLGMKAESRSQAPAFYVPKYLADAGFEIVPVPVYHPEVSTILGKPVYRRLVDIPHDIDMVNVFRRSQDLPPHLDDIIAKRPKIVWLQSGIEDDEFARALVKEGIDVVQDSCLLVAHRIHG